MATLRFSDLDAELLWCLQGRPRGLVQLLACNSVCNRGSTPSYEELAEFLSRGVRAGLVEVTAPALYRLTDEWQDRFDMSQIDFYDSLYDDLTRLEWPEVETGDFRLPAEEYRRAIAQFASGKWTE